jgi:hypothetical protein
LPKPSVSQVGNDHRCGNRRAEAEEVNVDEIIKVFPYGQPSVRVVRGGLDIPKPHREGINIIANAAVIVSFAMEAEK